MMWHHRINEVAKPGEGYARTHVVYERHWWKWTAPVWPACWLLGHKPGVQWNGGSSYIECKRCPARPFDVEGMRTFRHRLGMIRPGHGNWHEARTMERPTAEEERFLIGEITGRGAWSQREFEAHIEVPIRRRPRPEFSLRFHIGGRGSETPWDGHLTVLGSGLYWGLGFGGHMAERITKGKGRDIGVSVHDRKVWWQLWDTPGEWRNDQPKWWQGTFTVDPSEWLWGRRRYTSDKIGDPVTVTVETAEGTVHDDVVLQLQRSWHGWHRRPRPAGRDEYTVDWSTKSGFPYRFHDWKGDEVLGSGETLTRAEGTSPDWTHYAIQKIRAHVTRLRLDEGWTLDAYQRNQEAEATR